MRLRERANSKHVTLGKFLRLEQFMYFVDYRLSLSNKRFLEIYCSSVWMCHREPLAINGNIDGDRDLLDENGSFLKQP